MSDWCPPLRRAPGQKEPISPKFIIPWYAINSKIPVTNPRTGTVSELRSKVQLIPATDDRRFVPTVHLRVSGRERVEAAVEVSGGRAPYTYVSAGSNPVASEQTGASISYVPLVRAVPRPGIVLPENVTLARRETVGVTVTDANGVMIHESETLTVASHIVPFGKGGGPAASYGTESPREPDFAVDRVGWQNGMASPGASGGTQVFAWLGDLAWPGDFVEPNPPGTLVATPWINGDADYSNWGVNTAAIVLNNTDGWAEGFDSSQPGATIAEYATAELQYPSAEDTVVTGLLNGSPTATTQYSNINYNGSWTPVGPNDQLLWLIMDACDILDATDSAGPPSQRWGPAFGGLHLLTGFDSEEQVGDGSFEQDFAENMLGVSGPPLQIVIAWFNAAATAGMSHGVPAVMGALGPGGVCDQFDYYLGKGNARTNHHAAGCHRLVVHSRLTGCESAFTPVLVARWKSHAHPHQKLRFRGCNQRHELEATLCAWTPLSRTPQPQCLCRDCHCHVGDDRYSHGHYAANYPRPRPADACQPEFHTPRLHL